jgi:hypothetical protein
MRTSFSTKLRSVDRNAACSSVGLKSLSITCIPPPKDEKDRRPRSCNVKQPPHIDVDDDDDDEMDETDDVPSR